MPADKSNRERALAAERQLKDALARIAELEHAIENGIIPPKWTSSGDERVAEYSPSLIPRLFARADDGASLAEIWAEWGISDEQANEWAGSHVEWREALPRARTRARAAWERWEREAIARHDWKFPVAVVAGIMKRRFGEEAAGAGDAQDLIRVDVGAYKSE